MRLEEQTQIALVKKLRTDHPKVEFFHVPNGEKRDVVTAVKLKNMGVKKGVPDLYFPDHKLWVELKGSKKGKLSKDQQDFLDRRLENGDKIVIAHGLQDAVDKIYPLISESKTPYTPKQYKIVNAQITDE